MSAAAFRSSIIIMASTYFLGGPDWTGYSGIVILILWGIVNHDKR